MDTTDSIPFRAELAEDAWADDNRPRQVLEVAGEIDMATASAFEAALDQAFAACPHVVVDMANVTFIGSAGVGELMRAIKRHETHSATLFVTNASPAARRVFEICGLEGLLLEGKVEGSGFRATQDSGHTGASGGEA
jgi:anti-anti-sigma factor